MLLKDAFDLSVEEAVWKSDGEPLGGQENSSGMNKEGVRSRVRVCWAWKQADYPLETII